MEDFENLTPGGKGTAVVALVLIDRLHEDDFFIGIIAFAGCWIDLAAPLALVAAIVSFAPFYIDRNILLTAVSAPAVASSAVGNQHFRQPVVFIPHGRSTSLGV